MTIKIPAGKYIIGDPCYFNRECWDELLASSSIFEDPVATSLTGRRVVAFHTAYGDGLYMDQHGNQYPVDAGLIGVTPYIPDEHKDVSAGMLIEWLDDVDAYECDGVITFGEIRIDTSGGDEDDFDENFDYDSEE